MLYPTHIRTGYAFGFMVAIGFSSSVYVLNSQNGLTGLLMSVILTISGAAFGSGFPDIDSPRSIPARRHPIIKTVFKAFGVHHRGKFSHSVASETIFWAAVFGIIWFGLHHMMNNLDSQTTMGIFIGFRILFGCALGSQIKVIISAGQSLANSKVASFTGISNFILFLMTDDHVYSDAIKYRKPREGQANLITIGSYLIGFGLVFFIMPMNTSSQPIMIQNATYYLGVYIFSIWAGVMSHMLMDISTREGIYLLWTNRISPAKKMEQIPVLNLFVPRNQFKTGSGWETIVRIIVSIWGILGFSFAVLIITKLIINGTF